MDTSPTSTWLAIPLVWPEVRKRHPLALLALLLMVVPYLLFILVAHMRVTYPFYMLLFIPSQCILSALALSKLPRGVMLTFDDFVIGMEQFGTRIMPLMRCRDTLKQAA